MSRPGPAREIEQALKKCVSCGACLSVCPVYRNDRREEYSARGKLKVLQGCMSGSLDPQDSLGDMLASCLLCGRCQANCPNQTISTDGIRAGRELAARSGGLPMIKRLALQSTLDQPAHLDQMARVGRVALPLARPLARAAADLSSGLGLRLGPAQMTARLPLPDRHPFLSRAPREIAGPQGGPRIAFFVGCVTNYLRVSLAAKAVRLLSRIGTVVIPPGQACCGLPALAAGLGRLGRDLALANLAALESARPDLVVSVCGSCAHTLAREMPRQVGGPAAEHMGAKVKEISQVLVDHLDIIDSSGGARRPVAVHDPCHLKVGMGVSQEPRQVLRAAGLDLAPMEGADECCGGGGLFAATRPDLSQGIFKKRAEAFANSGAEVLATSCSGCYLQWSQGLGPRRLVAHPIELI